MTEDEARPRGIDRALKVLLVGVGGRGAHPAKAVFMVDGLS
jgi:hypothetical protein